MYKKFIPVSEILIEKDPSVTTGYDFTVEDFFTFCTDDGIFVQDSMTIIHPLSDKSQKEITEKMMNVNSAKGLSKSVIELSKEMFLGLYVMTKSKSLKMTKSTSINNDELLKITDPYITVSYRNHVCTSGFAILNSCFPQDFQWISEQATKKSINKLLLIASRKYDGDIYRKIIDRLSHEGFKWATIAGSSFTLANLDVPKEIEVIKNKMNGADPLTTSKLLGEAEKIIAKYLHDTGLGDIIESGSAKGYSQTMQIIVAKGLISSLDGDILPGIGKSFSDSLPVDVFFKAGQGSRSGMAGRAILTADTGYLARKLVYFLNSVQLHPSLQDCKTNKTIKVQIYNSNHLSKLQYRFVEQNGKIIPIADANIKVGDTINLRTPIYCKSEQICHTCHGTSYTRKATPYIGAMYALMLGESATQSSMEKFHTGGAVKIKKKDMLNDILFNAPILKKETVSRYVSNDENSISCKQDCILFVNVVDQKMSPDDDFYYNEDTKKIVFKALISKLKIGDIEIPIMFDYIVEADITNLKNQTKEELEFHFIKGETILYTSLEDTSMTGLSRYLDRLIGGRVKFYNVEHLLSIVYQQYRDISPLPVVAYEILISQILRCKDDPRKSARLGKTWNPELLNLKKTVYNEGFLQGLAFENMNEAIRNGLVQETGSDATVLEKVFTGEQI